MACGAVDGGERKSGEKEDGGKQSTSSTSQGSRRWTVMGTAGVSEREWEVESKESTRPTGPCTTWSLLYRQARELEGTYGTCIEGCLYCNLFVNNQSLALPKWA